MFVTPYRQTIANPYRRASPRENQQTQSVSSAGPFCGVVGGHLFSFCFTRA